MTELGAHRLACTEPIALPWTAHVLCAMSHHGQPKAVEECVRPKALQQQLEQRVAVVLEALPLSLEGPFPLVGETDFPRATLSWPWGPCSCSILSVGRSSGFDEILRYPSRTILGHRRNLPIDEILRYRYEETAEDQETRAPLPPPTPLRAPPGPQPCVSYIRITVGCCKIISAGRSHRTFLIFMSKAPMRLRETCGPGRRPL